MFRKSVWRSYFCGIARCFLRCVSTYVHFCTLLCYSLLVLQLCYSISLPCYYVWRKILYSTWLLSLSIHSTFKCSMMTYNVNNDCTSFVMKLTQQQRSLEQPLYPRLNDHFCSLKKQRDSCRPSSNFFHISFKLNLTSWLHENSPPSRFVKRSTIMSSLHA